MPQKGSPKHFRGGVDSNRCIICRAACPVGDLCKVVTDERYKPPPLLQLILRAIWIRFKDTSLVTNLL